MVRERSAALQDLAYVISEDRLDYAVGKAPSGDGILTLNAEKLAFMANRVNEQITRGVLDRDDVVDAVLLEYMSPYTTNYEPNSVGASQPALPSSSSSSLTGGR